MGQATVSVLLLNLGRGVVRRRGRRQVEGGAGGTHWAPYLCDDGLLDFPWQTEERERFARDRASCAGLF